MTLTLTAALIGAILAGSIFFLVRRDHLYGAQTFFWLLIAAAALLFGLSPGIVNWLGRVFAVAYPPILLVVLAVTAILLKLLLTDIEMARRERRMRRLTQKIALLEYELREARGLSDTPIEGTASSSGSADRRAAHTRPDKRRAAG